MGVCRPSCNMIVLPNLAEYLSASFIYNNYNSHSVINADLHLKI